MTIKAFLKKFDSISRKHDHAFEKMDQLDLEGSEWHAEEIAIHEDSSTAVGALLDQIGDIPLAKISDKQMPILLEMKDIERDEEYLFENVLELMENLKATVD